MRFNIELLTLMGMLVIHDLRRDLFPSPLARETSKHKQHILYIHYNNATALYPSELAYVTMDFV